MIVFTENKEIITYLKTKSSIGFVPTMGALHEGHLSMIKESKRQNSITVCSIFVNPIQFNNGADLAKYPRTLEQDIKLLESSQCDVLFAPSVEEIYPSKSIIEIDFGYQNTVMEGATRPGHFSGVGVVLSKLFHIVNPTNAYFGQKDFQQCLIVKQLIEELAFPIQLQVMPTLREKDGLAMSSRNTRLSIEARKKAPKIFQALHESIIDYRLMPSSIVSQKIVDSLQSDSDFVVEYVAVVDFQTGMITEILDPTKKYAVCIAVQLAEIRLIDNLLF